jgi:hypothetical protein
MRSPEAVLEVSAYQEACPHPGAAFAGAEPRTANIAMAAAAKVERRIVFNVVVPVELIPARRVQKWLSGAKLGEKVHVHYHGMLQSVMFVIIYAAIYFDAAKQKPAKISLKSGVTEEFDFYELVQDL